MLDRNQLVPIQLGSQTIEVPYGIPVGEAIHKYWESPPWPILAAIVHQRCVDLDYPVRAPARVVPVDYTMRQGVLVYRRTAALILLEAARRLFPGTRVTVGQGLGNGYFYRLHVADESGMSVAHVTALERAMREMVAADLPLQRADVSLDEARALFAELGFEDKLRLLKTYWQPFVPLVRLGDFFDVHHYPAAPRTGLIHTFQLVPYAPGMILRFPPRGQPQNVMPYKDTPKLFQVYRETRRWNAILGVETVGQLNELTVSGEASEVIRIAEGLHEKKIAHIADQIAQRKEELKLVLIAGPSSSGKTTFSKRLSLQLKVNGIRPVSLSTDNFYVNREDTPKDRAGQYDFEAIEAIDLDLFNRTLAALMRGEQVLSPRFDFTSGRRREESRWIPMKLEPEQVLVVEGIHGLNGRLTEAVGDEHKFKIYVSALTQLCIDDHNRIFTSDTRFLRRIVRDRLFRGYSAKRTIESWPSVRRGEMRNIFPYQEQADVMFNSALVYEQAALRLFAERFLLEVPQDDPAFVDAYRLLSFVQHFVPMFDETVPQLSILREFIGGSAFHY